jgi:DNA-binding MarR family transcriptional regulator
MKIYVSQVPQSPGQRYSTSEALVSLRQVYLKQQKRWYNGGILNSNLFKTVDGALNDPRLSSSEKLVLICIAYHNADRGEEIYPSLERIARMIGHSRTTVSKAIKELRGKGILEVSRPG